jgi:hypothetical protein
LIYSKVELYEAAGNKTAKSSIINQTLQLIKRASQETGGFVKQDPATKRWYAVDNSAARTTTAQAFRDALSSVYRSSKRAKQQSRWNRRTGDYDNDDEEGDADEEDEALIAITEDNSGDKGRRLNDVLDTALGMVGNMTPLLPASAGNSYFVPIAPRPQEISSSGGQQEALQRTREMCMEAPQPTLDFDAIWNMLWLHSDVTANPFEPTPISPLLAQEKKDAPLTLEGAHLNKLQCDFCRLKEAGTFAAPNSHANTAAASAQACASGGVSLRQALLSCVHQKY